MKKNLLIHLLFISVCLIVFSLSYIVPRLKKEIIYIALAGPMSGSYKKWGQEMLKGSLLYLDKIRNQGGGPENKKIELIITDDHRDERTAIREAVKLVSENKALLVLGHSSSPISVAAGNIYKKGKIPAITASATAESVTLENEWYFRIIPNNTIQANFIAHYISRALNATSVSLIFDQDSYGASLAKSFETAARELGISISIKQGFDIKDPYLNKELAHIAKKIAATNDPGMIFLATHGAEGVKLVKLLKDENPDTAYSIIGPDSFSARSFVERFSKYPREQSSPGHYSDGIYAASPYLMDIGTEKTYNFKQEYIDKYNEAPSWIAACYYDAMYAAVEAIKKADIRSNKNIANNRKKIRDALANFRTNKHAIRGITGNICFNANGDIERPYAMGFYDKQQFRTSFFQYQQPTTSKPIDKIIKKMLTGELISINGKIMNRVRVVYTGIHINEVSNIRVKNSGYTIDFYLWFRFQDDFNDADIEFINLVIPDKKDSDSELADLLDDQPIVDQPIMEEVKNDVITRVYRIKADFKAEFDFHDYPFDHHMIGIRFRHTDQTRDKLIYIPDEWGMPQSLARFIPRFRSEGNKRKIPVRPVPGWNIGNDISFYENSISTMSTLGNPIFFDVQNIITFSQFNAAIRIERKGLNLIKNFVPMIIMAVVLCLTCLVPPNRLGTRVLSFMLILISNAVCHRILLSGLPVEYLLTVEYGLFAMYLFVTFSVGISIFLYIRHKQGRAITFLSYAEKVFHPFVVLIVAAYFYFKYFSLKL